MTEDEKLELLEYRKNELRSVMEDISEDYMCASWLIGLEHELWHVVLGHTDKFCGEVLPISVIVKLRYLASVVNGWWIWNEDEGNKFIDLKEWNTMYVPYKGE